MSIKSNRPPDVSRTGLGAAPVLATYVRSRSWLIDRVGRVRSNDRGAIDLVTLVILVVAVAALALVVWGVIETAVTDKVEDLNLDQAPGGG